jgi:tetratricopeptide (TPR) repeat protein
LSVCNLKLDLVEKKNELILSTRKMRVAEAQLRALGKSASKWNFSPALQLATTLQQSGNVEEARGIVEHVLDLQPQNKAAIALLIDVGVIYQQRFDLNVAEAIYNNILEKDPGNLKALHLLGLVYGQQDKKVKSLDLIEKSIRLAVNAPPVFLKNAGLTAESLNDQAKAEKYFRQAMAKDKTFPDAYICLSRLLEKQGKFDGAEQLLLQGLELLPDNTELANQLQQLNYKSRDLPPAEWP